MKEQHKPRVWIFYDLDQTVIDTYLDSDGKRYSDKTGKPLYTREAWADVLYRESMINQREFVSLGEPWLKLATGEWTNEQAAIEANLRYIEAVQGKLYSDLVELARWKLAPSVVLKKFVDDIHVYFGKHAEPVFIPVTNVYDEICQGFNDAKVIVHDQKLRICNKPKLVNGRIGDGYDMDVSIDKEKHVIACLKNNGILADHTFGFIDRYPQDAWGKNVRYLYGIGDDKNTQKFVKRCNGFMMVNDRHIRHLMKSISSDLGAIIEEDKGKIGESKNGSQK